jgi:LPS sulfotransferase NodH
VSRAESPLRDRLVLLVGARRSGTNWLERILTAHPAVAAMPSETYLFSHALAPLAERFQHANPGSPMMGKTFLPREAFLDAARDLFDRVFLDHLGRADGEVRYLVERTPWHAQHLPLIADVYPDARVVHIVRDGRAVARSLLSADWGPDTMAEAAAEWRATVEGGRAGAQAYGDRYHEIVYEQLLADPQAGIADLFAWLGVELPGDVRERIVLEAASEFNVDPGSPGVGTDKWRDELSPEAIAEFERLAGDELEAFGYALSTPEQLAARAPARERPRPPAWRRRPGWAKASRARAFARHERRELDRHHQVAARFDERVARGDDAGAVELLSPQVRVRVEDAGERRDGRGEEAARDLLATLAAHRARGQRPLSGQIHLSAASFTIVGTYALDDGSTWARTMVLLIHGGRIAEVTLYRFALGSDRQPPP